LPADRAVRENLELANLMIVDRIEVPEDPLPLRVIARVQGLLTIEQESRLVLLLFVAANLLLSLYLLAGNSRYSYRALWASLAVGIFFVFLAASLSWKIYERDYRKSAVVVEARVDVRSGPGPENITVFTVHEGIKVRVHESSGGWIQVSLPNGWSGWLRANAIKTL
jgi:hypothetical protein